MATDWESIFDSEGDDMDFSIAFEEAAFDAAEYDNCDNVCHFHILPDELEDDSEYYGFYGYSDVDYDSDDEEEEEDAWLDDYSDVSSELDDPDNDDGPVPGDEGED